jgi:hypothetical protein
MSATLPQSRYSAEVILSLVVGDRTISLSQVGPHFVLLAEPTDLPPGPAEVHVNVDGHVHCRKVYLVDGINPTSTRIRIDSINAE